MRDIDCGSGPAEARNHGIRKARNREKGETDRASSDDTGQADAELDRTERSTLETLIDDLTRGTQMPEIQTDRRR
jgi:hypothetical protein